MSSQNARANIISRRAELMAALFLQDLKPQFLSRPTSRDIGYDLLVGFQNEKGGINTFAVEVRGTERLQSKHFPLPKRTFDRFADSNIPGLLLVADVKDNHMYFAWLAVPRATRAATVRIPLMEVDEVTTKELQKSLRATTIGVAAAG